MNIDKFLKLFVPKDHSFFPLFEADAKNLVKTADLLRQLMECEDANEIERLNKEIKEYELVGDDITNKTYEQLNKSFITPFDREDIHELTAHIDDVVDSINGVSRRMYLYKPKKLIPSYKKIAQLIYDAAVHLEMCITHLRDAGDNKSLILEACYKVKKIEHLVDELYFEGVSELFEKETDPKELMKNNKILEILERCVDEEEDVTDTIRAILVKMA